MKIFSFIDSMKKFSREMPDDDILVQYELNGEKQPLSFVNFEKRVMSFAALLNENGIKKGDNVIILYVDVMDFIVAFYACMYIGAVAVPVDFPTDPSNIEKWELIAKDSGAGFILTSKKSSEMLAKITSLSETLSELDILSEDMAERKMEAVEVDSQDLVTLQYTSGSTGNPKGVMVSYENLLTNIDVIGNYLDLGKSKSFITWLPYYHAMGLIASMLSPIYYGGKSVIVPAQYFTQNPLLWFKAITEYKGEYTVAPNFAYELMANVLEKLSDDEKSKYSLKSIVRCISGSEPVHINTFIRFFNQVEKIGLDKRTIMFAYGQSEATLVETAYRIGEDLTIIKADLNKLNSGIIDVIEETSFYNINEMIDEKSDKEVFLVANGTAISDHEITIRDPQSGEKLGAYTVGEIYSHGPSITNGYYNNPQATEESFGIDENGARYLKTGDLGFLNKKGELFITGRKKDLIIIRGKNFYPQDIERTVFLTDSSFVDNGTAAFSSVEDDTEKLIIVQSLKDGIESQEYEKLSAKIRNNVLIRFSIEVDTVIFVRDGNIEKTASGKIQRKANKERYYTKNDDAILFVKNFEETGAAENTKKIEIRENDIFSDLIGFISESSGLTIFDIDYNATFPELGISSMMLYSLKNHIEEKYNISIDAASVTANNTIRKMTGYIYSLVSGSENISKKKIKSNQYKIDTGNRYKPFPLNDIQKAYWVGRNKDVSWGGVSCYGYCEFDLKYLDLQKFEAAVKKLVERHEMLRTVIDSNGLQQIRHSSEIKIPLTIYSENDIENAKEFAEKIRHEMEHMVIPTDRLLFEFRVLPLGDNIYRFFSGVDLMAADAMSLFLMWNDLDALYNGEELPEINSSFRDYVTYMSNPVKKEKYRKDKEFWMKKLEDFPPSPELPVDLSLEKKEKGKFKRYQHLMKKDDWKRFVKISAGYGLTPSAALLAVYSEVLSGFGCGSRFGVIVTVFGRDNVSDDIVNVMGDFTKLALVDIKRDDVSFVQNALNIQNELQESIYHSDFSAVEYIKEIGKVSAENNIYPVVFTSGIGSEKITQNMFFDNVIYSSSTTPQVFMDHQVFEIGEDVLISWDVLEGIYAGNNAEVMFEVYIRLLSNASSDRVFWETKVSDLRPHSQVRIHEKVNQTDKDTGDHFLYEFIMKNFKEKPQNRAIVFEDKIYTYGDLHRKVNGVAAILENKNIRQGDRVIIQCRKSPEQIAAIIAVVMCGGVYVPVSYDQPLTRTKEIFKSSEAKCIISDISYDKFDDLSEYIIDIYCDSKKEYNFENISNSADSLAYIIYTSGSTGKPKGAAITHRSAMNTIIDVNNKYDVNENSAVIAVSSASFDLSVYDMFGILSAGGLIVLPTEKERTSPEYWFRSAEKYNVTIWNSVPSLFDLFLDYLETKKLKNKTLKSVILSGDWIPLHVPEKMSKYIPKALLISMGGATEASIWSNYYEVKKFNPQWKSIPYGYPLENQKFFILDEFNRQCPDMVAGRLFIAGKGVAQGYYNSPEITEKSFQHIVSVYDGILYETGDWGRYHKNGCIEFLGRKDNQLKINGYRVEIGEIQEVMKKSGAEDSVIVLIGEKADNKRLIAFVVSSYGENEMKANMRKYLPEYFIPDKIMVMEKFPVTPNGKIDRKALISEYEKNNKSTSPAVNRVLNETEKKITEIIKEVLSAESIDINESFMTLGVSSVEIIKIANHLEVAFGQRPDISEIMAYKNIGGLLDFYKDKKQTEKPKKAEDKKENTIKTFLEELLKRNIYLRNENGKLKFTAEKNSLTDEIRSEIKNRRSEILEYLSESENILDSREIPLKPIQRAYVIGRSDKYELGNIGAHYYTEFIWNECNVKRLETAVNCVVQSQDIMRMVINDNGTQTLPEAVQRYEVKIFDFDEKALADYRNEISHRTYKIGSWPMFEISVSNVNGEKHIHFSIDCIILDGWSAYMFMEQIFRKYNGLEITAPSIGFGEYIRLEEDYLKKNNYREKSLEFWKKRIKELPPAPQLPYVKAMSEVDKPYFKRLQYALNEELSAKLESNIKKYKCTESVVICGAYMKTLFSWCNEKPFTLNLTLFNRIPVCEDISDVFGDFTNTTFIAYNRKESFLEDIEDIKNQMIYAIENRYVNGIEIVKEISDENSNKAVFPVVFTSMLRSGSDTDNEIYYPENMKEVYALSQTPQVSLDHQVYNRNGKYVFVWDYVSQLYDEKEIMNCFDRYIEFIKEIADNNQWN